MAVSDVTESTFSDEVIAAPIPVVVDYWADWCAPCKQLSPIVEELFFRGLLQRSLLRWMGPAPAIALQAGVFAFTHFQKLQFAALFAFGVVLGYLAHRTGRLGPGIAAHMVFNGAAVLNLVVLQ